jgi:hypothetical protein
VAGAHRPLVSVPLGHKKIEPQVHRTQHGQKPEKIVKIAIIQVFRYPSRPAMPCAEARDDINEQRAQIASQRGRCERQSRAQAPHGIRRLLVKELQLPYERENFGASDDEILRDLPKY